MTRLFPVLLILAACSETIYKSAPPIDSATDSNTSMSHSTGSAGTEGSSSDSSSGSSSTTGSADESTSTASSTDESTSTTGLSSLCAAYFGCLEQTGEAEACAAATGADVPACEQAQCTSWVDECAAGDADACQNLLSCAPDETTGTTGEQGTTTT